MNIPLLNRRAGCPDYEGTPAPSLHQITVHECEDCVSKFLELLRQQEFAHQQQSRHARMRGYVLGNTAILNPIINEGELRVCGVDTTKR